MSLNLTFIPPDFTSPKLENAPFAKLEKVENEVETGICTPCANNRKLDEAAFHSNMALDGGPHLIDMAAEAKVFNF